MLPRKNWDRSGTSNASVGIPGNGKQWHSQRRPRFKGTSKFIRNAAPVRKHDILERNEMATSCTLRERHQSLLGEAAGRLVLRVVGGEHAGKVLHLRSQKCTIGSDPHATLRLRADGVRPVHCQILRGEQGTFVRRWSSGTRLNGSRFEFRRLKTGDQLDIGHIEFEVLEPTPLEPEDELKPSDWKSSGRPDEGCQSEPRIAQLQAVIQGQRDEWYLDRENLQRELADRVEALRKNESQHNDLMDEAEHLIHALQHEGKQLLAQLSEAKQTIRQNAEDRRILESATMPFGDSVELAAFSAANGDSSPDVTLSTAVTPSNNTANGFAPSSPGPGPVEMVKDVDDEGYIHDYMRRLLGQGSTAAPHDRAESKTDEITTSEASEALQESDCCELSSASKDNLIDVAPPSRRQAATGPVVAPEATNIDALRELANCSTRSAINTSQRRQSLVAAIGQVGVAATASICGLVALALSPELISGPAAAGAIGLAFGLNRAWRVAKLLQRARCSGNAVASQRESAND